MDEFLISKQCLEEWIGQFVNATEPLKHNAIELQNFLSLGVLSHKECCLFFLCAGRLTLDTKTTSPLEALNGGMKKNSTIQVKPNMMLLMSLKKQDSQTDQRMQERTMQCCLHARGRSMSIRSGTVNDITLKAESQIHMQCAEYNKYSCQVRDACWNQRVF